MSEPKTHSGSCHCGNVRYEATLALGQVVACNCSICNRVGHLLAFVPVEQFRLLSGEDSLVDYRFNAKKIAHLFCSTCGIHPFGRGKGPDGKETYAVNVRCLDGVDPRTLEVMHYDGKSI
ncbi:GFA family protein [Vulgatibacter incomptus]|uniref:Gfa-like protein n=1 Tax=Vulgatibacter incomptus TaxID=1391653 RepID=A0A0K1PHI4_9BACT|nr:GFA family protein [Vulgatibacter incomptus]AKU92972.1 Gfa-like protein [Vulgatibacter incomptus]